MISTGTLMLLKALLTACVLLGLCIWQLLVLRRLRREREARKRLEAVAQGTRDASAEDSAHRARAPQ